MPTVKKGVSGEISRNDMTQAQIDRQKKNKDIPTLLKNGEFVCYSCGCVKPVDSFYACNDPFNVVGVVPFCKLCLERVARRYDEARCCYGDVTVASLRDALERADKPFIKTMYDASVEYLQRDDTKATARNLWSVYITNLTRNNKTKALRWRDGDVTMESSEKPAEKPVEAAEVVTPDVVDDEAKDMYLINKREVIRLVGYDPFAKENEEDKPMLYAQLIGYIDASGDNEDQTRLLDSIEIVRGYCQLQKLNDLAAKSFNNVALTGNTGEIKNYMDTKKKLSDVIAQLAEQSCISLKHNKNASKGENTWAGKIKKLKELNLREAEVNAFDIETAKGMQQVADISNASIIKQLHLDENDYTEMLAQQRDLITKLQRIADESKEEARILLRENLDLKATLSENGISIEEGELDE